MKNPMNGWQARWFHLALWLTILTFFVIFLRSVQPILLPFVLGMLVAYLMDPITGWLERRRLSRISATALVTLAFFSLIVGLTLWLIPVLVAQAERLMQQAPTMLQAVANNLRGYAAPILERLNSLGGAGADAIPADSAALVARGMETLSNIMHGIFSSGAQLLNTFALLMLTPIVSFYLIRDWPSVMKKADALLPLAYAPIIREQLSQINQTLAAYLRGQITVMAILTVYYVVAFLAIGLNYGLVLGLLAGLLVIVPYLGSLLSVGLGLVVAYGQFDMSQGFWVVVVVYGAGQLLEQQVLTPKIIGDRVGLHPLWMLFGMLAGAVLLGLVGVLLAVPLTAVIGVLAKFAIQRYLQSGLYLDK